MSHWRPAQGQWQEVTTSDAGEDQRLKTTMASSDTWGSSHLRKGQMALQALRFDSLPCYKPNQ